MHEIERINSILLSYIESVSISHLAILCHDSNFIINNLHNHSINAIQVRSDFIKQDLDRIITNKWHIDLLYIAPSERDIYEILKSGLFNSIRGVTKNIIFDIAFSENVNLIKELLVILKKNGFYASKELIFENIGSCYLRQFSNNIRSSDEILRSMLFGRYIFSNRIADMNIILSENKRKILEIHDIKELRGDRDWKFSIIPNIKNRNIISWPQEIDLYAKEKRSFSKIHSSDIRFVLFVIATNQPEWMLNETIESINNQYYNNWEIIVLALKSDLNRSFVNKLVGKKSKNEIKVLLLDEKSKFRKKAASMLTLNDYFAVVTSGDTLPENALINIYRYILNNKSSNSFETDTMEISRNGQCERLRLGPSQDSVNYNNKEYDLFSINSANILLGCSKIFNSEQKATYIPIHCYNMRTSSDMSDWQKDFIEGYKKNLNNNPNVVSKTIKKLDRLRWRKHDEKISVICVSRLSDAASVLAAQRISSYFKYDKKIEFIITSSNINENSNEIKFIDADDDINIVEKIKLALEIASGSIIVFIDVAYRPMFPDWIDELVGPILDLNVGIVGGKIVKRSNGHSSAGITFDLSGKISNIIDAEVCRDISSSFLRHDDYRFRFAVSGGAFATRKNLFNSLGGFELGRKFPRLDVDLCLRAQKNSIKILYNPYAVFWSFGPAVISEWLDDSEWGAAWLRKNYPVGDPFSSPNIVCNNGVYCLRDSNMQY